MTSRDSRDEGSIRIEHLFDDDRPFAQCHAATLVALPGGAFLAAWFAGTRESHEDVAIWAATREAPTTAGSGSSLPQWSAPREIAKVADEAHWNPVLFALDEAGEHLVLHFKVGGSIRSWVTWMQSSTDAGRTWSEARPLDLATKGDGMLGGRLRPRDRRAPEGGRGAVRAKPIRLDSGAWLAGASIERWRRWDAFFDRSADGLGGWQNTPLVPIDRRRFRGKGLIQPSLWESAPGQVHAVFRSTDGRIHRSDSSDDGHTWSESRAMELPNNNSGLDIVRMHDGLLALVCNPVPGNWAARTPLSILFSRDDGESWPDRIDIETEPGEFSYPALIEHEGGLALAYTWNRRRIAFVSIPPSALPGA